MKTMMQRFGAIIREERRYRGLTQAEAAAFCGVSRRTWQRWEAGGRPRGYEARVVMQRLGMMTGGAEPKEMRE